MSFKAKNINGTVYFLARLSYANVFEPKAFSGQDPKYSVSLLIPKTDKATLSVIKEAIEAAKEYAKDKKWGGKVPAKLRLPIRDGDEDRPEDEAYEGMFFINANAAANRAPKLLTRVKGQEANEEDIYSGSYAVAIVNFYGYSVSGNVGIGCGLMGLQAWKDGERLAGANIDVGELEYDSEDDTLDDLDFLS